MKHQPLLPNSKNCYLGCLAYLSLIACDYTGPRYIHASDPLEFRSLTPDIDPMTIFTLYSQGKQGAPSLWLLFGSAQSGDMFVLVFVQFGKWMLTHIDSWFAFTQSLGSGIRFS
jgi:hypothetical protein